MKATIELSVCNTLTEFRSVTFNYVSNNQWVDEQWCSKLPLQQLLFQQKIDFFKRFLKQKQSGHIRSTGQRTGTVVGRSLITFRLYNCVSCAENRHVVIRREKKNTFVMTRFFQRFLTFLQTHNKHGIQSERKPITVTPSNAKTNGRRCT